MMKRCKTNYPHKFSLLGLSMCLCLSWGFVCCVHAQPRKAQSGEISFEGDDKKETIASSKEAAFEYVSTLSKKLQATPAALDAPTDNDISYFNAVYLYCTINNGTCPAPLEALYEIDLINAFHSKRTECPILTRFWKSWLGNGFEDRQKYMIKTAHISSTNSFTNQVRPKYIKCAPLIQANLDSIGGDPQKFAGRYGPEGTGTASVAKFSEQLKTIQESGIDVFAAVGIMGKIADSKTDAKKKKK